MPELARLSFETEGDVELAHVAGEVDASNVDDLTEQLLDAVSNEARAVVLDLTQTSYIDSSGISLIFDAAARMKNRRQQLRLVVVPKLVRRRGAGGGLDGGLGADRSRGCRRVRAPWIGSRLVSMTLSV